MFYFFAHVKAFPESKDWVKDRLRSFIRLFAQGAASLLIRSYPLCWLWCVPGEFLHLFFSSYQTLLLLLVIFSALEFSLPPFMRSFIFLSLSPAPLLCNICGELISSQPDNGSGPGVIITGYYRHLFQLRFHVRAKSIMLLPYWRNQQSDVTYCNSCQWFSGTLKKPHGCHSGKPALCPQSFCLFSFFSAVAATRNVKHFTSGNTSMCKTYNEHRIWRKFGNNVIN